MSSVCCVRYRREEWPSVGEGKWTSLLQSRHLCTPFTKILQTSRRRPQETAQKKSTETFKQKTAHKSNKECKRLMAALFTKQDETATKNIKQPSGSHPYCSWSKYCMTQCILQYHESKGLLVYKVMQRVLSSHISH